MNQNHNEVQLLGTICDELKLSHTVHGEQFFTLGLEVARLSGQKDRVPIILTEKLCFEQNLKFGGPLWVKGQLRSYNQFSDGKRHLLLSVFARDAETDEFWLKEQKSALNEIGITGYLCKEPVYRTTPFGREICDMLLAVNRSFGKSDYIPCISWGKLARKASCFNVGEQVTLTGRIQSRTYQKQMDNAVTQKTAYEVSVSSLAVV